MGQRKDGPTHLQRGPLKVRGQVWALLLDVEQLKADNPGKYEEVGYRPEMNHVAALLLMFMLEEHAFWALVQLLGDRSLAMDGFFVLGEPKLCKMKKHLEQVLGKVLPQVKEHLDEEMMTIVTYTKTWFLQAFEPQVPFGLSLRLWDAFILDGDDAMTAIALSILKVHQRRLLQLPGEDVHSFLMDRVAQPWGLGEDEVVRHLQASMVLLRKLKLCPPSPGNEDFWQLLLDNVPEPPKLGPLLAWGDWPSLYTEGQYDLPGPPVLPWCCPWRKPERDDPKLLPPPPCPPIIRKCFSNGHLDTWGAPKKSKKHRVWSMGIPWTATEPSLFKVPALPRVSFSHLMTLRHDNLQRVLSNSTLSPPQEGVKGKAPVLPSVLPLRVTGEDKP